MHAYCVELPRDICEDAGFTYVAEVAGTSSEACFRVNNADMLWQAASDECQLYNSDAHLAVILTQEKQAAIASFFASDSSYIIVYICRKSRNKRQVSNIPVSNRVLGVYLYI